VSDGEKDGQLAVTSARAARRRVRYETWHHCHILEHEDHDMMRPFVVVAPDAFALMPTDIGGMAI
jgi:FtsP/CotA-like multicopper oxidase with cupredoxin domain